MSKQLAGYVALWCIVSSCHRSEPEAISSVAPVVKPQLADATSVDRNRNKLTDTLEARATGEGLQKVNIAFTGKPGAEQREAFAKLGGTIDYEFKHISYGFIGRLPASRVAELPQALGSTLHLVSELWPTTRTGDVEMRQARIRPVWPTTRGSANTTIAIFDTGLDITHPDFAGRQVFWKDYSVSGHPTSVDIGGHGTHVAGLALGSGAAFDDPAYGGALRVTNSGNNSFGSLSVFSPSPLTASFSATYNPGGPGTFYVIRTPDDGGAPRYTTFLGSSPISTTPVAAQPGEQLSAWVGAASGLSSTWAITASAEGYPRDPTYPTMSGAAPLTRTYTGKVFGDDGANDGSELLVALDELVDNRVTYNVKVLNLSLSTYCPDGDPMSRAAFSTVVDNGITVVAAAGNRGPTGQITEPGVVATVISVGAISAPNQVSSYTSIGTEDGGDPSIDMKPDLLAPSGPPNVGALSPDSNASEAENAAFPDVQHDDYRTMQGTSMASPVVAGAAALLIDALEQEGYMWSYASSVGPLKVKNLLLATATETNTSREGTTVNPPTLGRATTPKDSREGYGQLNLDAAVEAVRVPYSGQLTVTIAPGEEKRAWARRVNLAGGSTAQFTLATTSLIDLDLYIYSDLPDSKGNPLILASSTSSQLGATETATVTADTSRVVYVVVKRVSGTGSFTLSGVFGGVPVGTPDGGPTYLSYWTLVSDKGNPSVSTWTEQVTLTFIAVGTAANGAPTGSANFQTTGPLVPGGPAVGGSLGVAPLIANGPGCETQPSPCSSAVFTTTNIQPYDYALRLYVTYSGSVAYTSIQFVMLNNSFAPPNHTINPLPTTTQFEKPMQRRIRGNSMHLTAHVTTPCPAGKTCGVAPRIGSLAWPMSCSATPTGAYDLNWSADCYERNEWGPVWQAPSPTPINAIYGQGPTFHDDLNNKYFAASSPTGTAGGSIYPWGMLWDPVFLKGPTCPVPYIITPTEDGCPDSPVDAGTPVRFEISAQSDGTVAIVDGQCTDYPTAPVLTTVVFPENPDAGMVVQVFTTSDIPSGYHMFRPCTVLPDGGWITAKDLGKQWAVVPLTVLPGKPVVTTTTTLQISPATTVAYGAPVTFTAQVTPATAGSVQFSANGVVKQQPALDASGNASWAPLLEPGSYAINAQFVPPMGALASSASEPNFVVTKAMPEVLLTLSPPGPFYAVTNVLLNATVLPPTGSSLLAALPTGTVTFRDGATVICQSIPLANLTGSMAASCLFRAPSATSHTVTATYEPNGDPHYDAPAPASKSFSFLQAAQTSSTVSPPGASSVWGERVTFTLSVGTDGGATGASGTALFKAGNDVLCAAAPVVDGVATCTSSSLPLSSSTELSVSYSGDSSFTSSMGYTTHSVSQAGSATRVTCAPSPVQVGQPVSCTLTAAAKAPGSGFPSGTLELLADDGGTVLPGMSGLTLSGAGAAVFTTSALAAGPHTLRASYSGDTYFLPSVLPDEPTTPLNVVVITNLSVDKTPDAGTVYGDTVTLSAQVTGGPPVAIGNVSFSEDGGATTLVTLDGTGRAVLSTATLGAGMHTFVVHYDGDSFHGSLGDVEVQHTVTKVGTSITLTTSAEPGLAGAPLTLIATVTEDSGAGSMTGNVIFRDGSTIVGIVPIVNGAAVIDVNSLSAGSHTLTAEYVGDANVDGSTSATFTQTIEYAPTVISTSLSDPAPEFGDSLGLSVSVVSADGGVITGNVVLTEGGTTLGTFPLDSSGAVTINLSSVPGVDLSVGSHSFTVTYDGSAGAVASSTVSVSIAPATTNTTLTSSLPTWVWGQAPVLTAHVSTSPDSGAPTGPVTFKSETATLGSSTLSSSNALLTVETLPPGVHTLTARYEGDFAHDASASLSLDVTVNKSSTLTTVIASSNVTPAGVPVTLTASVTPVAPGAGNPSGAVTFTAGGSSLGASQLNASGTATLDVSSLPEGAHALEASYAGDDYFLSSATSLGMAWLTVGTGTTMSLTATPNPAPYLSTVQLAVSIDSANGHQPEGTVTLTQDTNAIGTVTLNGGAASFAWQPTLAPGTYPVTATYTGDATHDGGTTASVMVTIDPRASTLTLKQSSESSTESEAVTFTAKLTLDATPPNAPAVSIFDGRTRLADALPVLDGGATFTTTGLAVGTHAISAKFDGQTGFSPAASDTLTHTVTKVTIVKQGCGCNQPAGSDLLGFLTLALFFGSRLRRR